MECRLMIWSATSRITSGLSLPTGPSVSAVVSLIGSSPSAGPRWGHEGPGRSCRSRLLRFLWRNACFFRPEDRAAIVRGSRQSGHSRSVEGFVAEFVRELRLLFLLDLFNHAFSS